jgi:hypothetical protein
MTRVRSKANPELAGTVLEDGGSDLWVQWDDHEYPGQRWRIARDRVEEIPDKPQSPEVQLLDMLDNLRDGLVLQIECAMNDIRRNMKK